MKAPGLSKAGEIRLGCTSMSQDSSEMGTHIKVWLSGRTNWWRPKMPTWLAQAALLGRESREAHQRHSWRMSSLLRAKTANPTDET